MSNNYIIIKFYERMVFQDPAVKADANPVWAKVVARHRRGVATPVTDLLRISRLEALDIIRRDGLVEVLRNEHGVVFDTPDKAFWKEYHGEIGIPSML